MHGDWCSLMMERVGVKHVIYPSPLHHYFNFSCWCALRLENENFHQRICKFETLTGYLLYHVSWWWCEHCHCSFASKDRWDSGGGCSHPVLMHLLLRQIMMGRSLDLRKKSSPLSLSSVSARWCLDIGHVKPFLFLERSLDKFFWTSYSLFGSFRDLTFIQIKFFQSPWSDVSLPLDDIGDCKMPSIRTDCRHVLTPRAKQSRACAKKCESPEESRRCMQILYRAWSALSDHKWHDLAQTKAMSILNNPKFTFAFKQLK